MRGMSTAPGVAQASRAAPRVPGDWLLHPLPLGAALVLALNDRVLKAAYGTWWTGKLSDVTGLLFFPWFLLSVWEIARWALRRRWQAEPSALSAAIAFTLVVFSAINVSDAAGALYEAWLRQVWSALAGSESCLFPGRVRHTVDPTDLLALPALWVPWRLGLRRIQGS